MKTFKQFIDEAYNFRLGGSQKKGFNQPTRLCDMSKGDTFYWWFGKDYIGEFEFYKAEVIKNEKVVKIFFTDEASMNISLDGYEDFVYTNKYPSPDGTKPLRYAMSTSLQLLIKTVKEKFGVELKEDYVGKKFDDLYESYSFRLGGSKEKGFDKNMIKKSFKELEPGDVIYWYSKENGRTISAHEFEEMYIDEDGVSIIMSGGEWSACTKEDLDETVLKNGDWAECIATNLNDLYVFVEKEYNDRNPEDIDIQNRFRGITR